MDENRFTVVPRSLTSLPSRRDVLRGLAGAGLGLGGIRLPEAVAARKKRKKKKKTRRNAFGCLSVGVECKSAEQCCSGICEGKKCRAHGASTCRAGQSPADLCEGPADIACTTSAGDTAGDCYTTTGNAPYCASEIYCRACGKDADCQPFCGEAAACIKCAGCTLTGGTACASPTLDLCEFPPEMFT